MNCKTIFALCIILICHTRGNGQANLIKNSGFEQHGAITCLGCDLTYGKYTAYVYSWDNLGYGGTLYDSRYKLNSDEKKGVRKEIPAPHEGNSMIGAYYIPDCGGWGCIDYLCAKTTETMKVGHLYEISYWVHIQAWEQQDTNWAKHIGMAILPKKIQNNWDLVVPALHIDTVIYDQWYRVKWKVRPLCNSDYLLIGTFRTKEWPKSRSFKDSYYYIDDVSVVQQPDPEGGVRPDSSTYYCSQYNPVTNPKLKPDMERLQLYFETASTELSPAAITALDSLAVFARQYPSLVFEISGHTDSIGTENEVLSQKRVQSVANYWQEKHGMAAHRLVTCSFGSKRPVATNQTEAGRALNRRVEIRVADLTLPQAYYRQALAAANTAEKFKYLHKWLKLEPGISQHALLLDPRFDHLKKDNRWVSLQKQIRESYKSQKYPRQAFLLDSLFMDDEMTSGALTQSLNYLSGYSPALDSVYFDGLPEYSEVVVAQKSKERFTKGFKPILKQVGWPTNRVFGKSTENAAFFLLYHAEDTSAMAEWLPIIKASCEAGETPWVMYAKIYDRCQVLQQKPQRYGTQTMDVDGKTYVRPCEGDREEVNRLRAKWNLPLVPDSYVLF